MSDLPLELYKVKQIREFEELAIKSHKITAETLMLRAGQAAYRAMQSEFDPVERIVVMCGKGNNAGDGYVLAKQAHDDGIAVVIYHLGQLTELPKVAKAMADECVAAGIDVKPFPAALEFDDDVDVIVDAILGIGISGEVKADVRAAIEAINAATTAVLAIDIPSGINADTGAICGAAVNADLTVTFAGVKQGLVTGAAREYSGVLVFEDLDLPTAIYEAVPMTAYRLELQDIQTLLIPRPRHAHKGDFGHVLVVGGDYGMAGAVRMAGEAAARVGAGLVTIATRHEHIAAIVSNRPELMCYGIDKAEELKPLLDRASVVVIGPGLGQSTWSTALFQQVIASQLPLIVDASALHLLAQEAAQRDNWILTPHPGEAAQLLKTKSQDIERDRYQAALALQKKYDGVIVLKGAGTIVQASGEMPQVSDAGNPGMASGGMGDILSGIIAGLLAQGFGLPYSAAAGVCLHATAADQAAAQGERGLLALDVLAQLRGLINPYQLELESRPRSLEELLSQTDVDSYNEEEEQA